MSNAKKTLIITESHRAISQPIKDTLGLRCLSCTFLPRFTQSVLLEVSKTDHYFIQISNANAVHIDGISRWETEKLLTKRYFGNIVPMILDMDEGGDILLAQDNDGGGNLMASLLYYKLIANGVEKKRIKRIIGIEAVRRNGIKAVDIYTGSFIPFELLMRIMERHRMEHRDIAIFMSIDRRLGKGYRNIVSLNESINNSYYEDVVPRASEGVALATYLTKWALDEK